MTTRTRPGLGKPSILFATIAAGGGHVATARAMSEAVERYYPGLFDLRVSDYMKEVGPVAFDKRHKALWRQALRYPVTARAGQRVTDAFPRANAVLQRRMLRGFARAADRLRRDPPLLVVSNHGLLSTGLAESKRLYGLPVPVLTFATEPHGISAYWAEPNADHIVVPTRETFERLLSFGVPARRMTEVGYPVRQPFLNALPKPEARARLGLEDRFTCIVSLGGEGVGGRPRRLVDTLLRSSTRPQVVVLAGRNTALRDELSALGAPPGLLRVEGFVEDAASFLAASDVVVGKAGPASVYEALAVGRPLLVTSYAGLNEKGVLRFVKREGFGSFAGTPADLEEGLRRFASTPALLDRVSLQCRRLGLEEQTEKLARYVVGYARRAAR